ncbi:MAG: ThuA domain-containing protein [Clostridiales bacterium]|jgi:trehalose utilization protein|nr:ThuA domain-containing protein [Clostridiales bacterium]
MVKVTVWHETVPAEESEGVRKVYPEGLGAAVAAFLKVENFQTRCAYLGEKDDGLPEEVLRDTDALIWWGHGKHHLVSDETVKRVVEYVNRGMGAIFLHSAHLAKPFKALLGTSCTLQWREAGEREIVWAVNPAHPIAAGLDAHFTIEHEEMYGEPFDIPEPDELVFIGWFKGGNVFRCGAAYRRGRGKVFYFQPGHETYPVYRQKEVRHVICNAVRWAAPVSVAAPLTCPHAKNSIETLT